MFLRSMKVWSQTKWDHFINLDFFSWESHQTMTKPGPHHFTVRQNFPNSIFYPTQNNTSLFFQLHRPIFKPARCGFVGTSRLSLSMHITQVDVGPGRWWIFYPQGFQPFRIELNGVLLAVVQKRSKNGWRKTNRFSAPPTWSWHEMRLAARCIGHGSLLCAAGVVMVWSRWFRDASAWAQGTDVFEGKPVMQCDMLAVIGSPRPRKTKW